jgi:hypothetical protein
MFLRPFKPESSDYSPCPFSSLWSRDILQRTLKPYRYDVRSDSSGDLLQLGVCLALVVVVFHIRLRREGGLHSQVPALGSVIEASRGDNGQAVS